MPPRREVAQAWEVASRGAEKTSRGTLFRSAWQISMVSDQGDRVLRIHRTANGQVAFKLSGRMDKGHIAELETLIGSELKGQEIVLDLKDVTLVGQDAITFLERCEANGITLVNCAPYVREWITRQRSGM